MALLITLSMLALASLVIGAVGLVGRADSWWRIDQIGSDVPSLHRQLPGNVDIHETLILNSSGGGLLVSRLLATGPAGTPMSTVVQGADGSLTQIPSDGSFHHHVSDSGSYPTLLSPATGSNAKRYGFKWLGLQGDLNAGYWRIVIPWPVLALVLGVWPAVATLLWYHRRRRGESAFPVIEHAT